MPTVRSLKNWPQRFKRQRPKTKGKNRSNGAQSNFPLVFTSGKSSLSYNRQPVLDCRYAFSFRSMLTANTELIEMSILYLLPCVSQAVRSNIYIVVSVYVTLPKASISKPLTLSLPVRNFQISFALHFFISQIISHKISAVPPAY